MCVDKCVCVCVCVCAFTYEAHRYFCFRWLLIRFKREFETKDTMRLWEALWASQDPHLHLFVALAILRQHKAHMMAEDMGFDEVLQFVNGLALQIDCDATLKSADWLSQLSRCTRTPS